MTENTKTRSKAAKHKRPRKTAKPKQPAVTVEHSEHEIPIGKIVVDQNDRQHFDEESLRMLAESIKLDGVLAPLLVRPSGAAHAEGPDFELVAGERRLRAAQIAMLDTVPCRVRMLDDAAVARMRLAENYFREDLNAIEEAAAFQRLIDEHGFSHQELADQFGLSKAKIGNAVRLLKLPEDWRQRVISQEITATHARELATWADCPAVLQEVARYLEGDPTETLIEWRDTILMAAYDVSRPLKGTWYDEGLRRRLEVKLTKKECQREDLDVREVPHRFRQQAKPEKRAFNVALWQELVLAAEERRQSRQQTAEDPATTNNAKDTKDSKPKQTAAEKREQAKQQREAWQKKLTRYYCGWLQRMCLLELESLLTMNDAIWQKLAAWFAVQPGPDRRLQELAKTVTEMGGREKQKGSGYYSRRDAWATLDTLKCVMDCDEALQRACLKWVAHEFEGYNADVKPHMLQGLAAELEVGLQSHWRCDREFLELHTKDQLGALAKEWKIPAVGGKRSERVDAMLAEQTNREQPFPPPKDLVKIAKKPAAL